MKASYFGHVGVIGTCFLLFLARWSIYVVVVVVGILVVAINRTSTNERVSYAMKEEKGKRDCEGVMLTQEEGSVV